MAGCLIIIIDKFQTSSRHDLHTFFDGYLFKIILGVADLAEATTYLPQQSDTKTGI